MRESDRVSLTPRISTEITLRFAPIRVARDNNARQLAERSEIDGER
jgi:hypothetical protein